MINYLTDDFDKEIAKDKVLVDFYADWCGPCRMMGEILEEVKDIDILKVNVDKYPNIAKKYGVMSIPTLILFEKGKIKKTNVGLLELNQINEFIK